MMNPYDVLLVDDESNNLSALGRILKREYKVFSATSSEDALGIMEQNDIALIIADEHITDMSGPEFLQKTLKKHPDAIGIVLAGDKDEGPVISAIDKGNIYKYIGKPWEPEEVRTVVREGIDAYEYARSTREPHIWALLHSEIITGEQLVNALRVQSTQQKPLSHILLERGMVLEEQLEMAAKAQKTGEEEQERDLGEVLMELNAISSDDLEKAREIQKKERRIFSEILVDLGYASEETILSCYALQLGIPYISLSQFSSRPEVAELLPSELAYKHTIVPIDSVGRVLVVVASEPLSDTSKAEIEAATGYKVMAVCAPHHDVEVALGQCYAEPAPAEDNP